MVRTSIISNGLLLKFLQKLVVAFSLSAGYTFYIILDIFLFILEVLMMPLFLVLFLVLKVLKK